MNLAALDKRLDEDIKTLEIGLNKYEKFLQEAAELKNIYEANIDSGEAMLNHFTTDLATVKKKSSQTYAMINKYYESALKVLGDLENKKAEFEQYVTRFDKILQDKLAFFQQRNEDNLHNLDSRIKESINQMEEVNKLKFLQLINDLSKQEQEIITSRNDLTSFITSEMQKLLEKNILMDEQLASFDKRLLEQKSELESNFEKGHHWVEKELELLRETNEGDHKEITNSLNKTLQENYEYLGKQNQNIIRKMHYFMIATGFFFVITLIMWVGR